MSYAGVTDNLWRMTDVSKRVRMFLQGKVYLRDDLDAEDTTVCVGQGGSDRAGGCDIPTQFFNGHDTPIEAVLEQQTSSGADTTETEDVAISAVPAFASATYGLELTLSSGPEDDYTTAKNARIGYRTHPVTDGDPPPLIPMGYMNFFLNLEQPIINSYNLPCLAVHLDDVSYDDEMGGNALRAETYVFTCTWMREISSDQNIDEQLMSDVSMWMKVIDDDNYLGGGVEFSEPLGPNFDEDEELRTMIRLAHNCDIIHFGIRAVRGEIRNKFE